MQEKQSTLSGVVIAIAEDGTTYRIEKRSRPVPGDCGGNTYFYCCLPHGEIVTWLGGGHYQLPNAVVVRTLPSHLRRK